MKKNVIIFFTAIFVLITFWGIQSQGEQACKKLK